MFRLVCLLIGYIIGCVQSAYVVGKIMRVDIRQHGSGNLGTTNALRVLGKRAGAVTFACDILKSVIAFVICYNLYGDLVVAGVYASVGAVLGHDFPFYLKFKGGKGIAATGGMMLALSFASSPWFAITYAIGILAVVLTNQVSVGSITFSVIIPILCAVLNVGAEITLVTIALGVLAIYKHKENIIRIKNGTENKLVNKKKA